MKSIYKINEKKLQQDIAFLATQLYPPNSITEWIIKDLFYKDVERGIMSHIEKRAYIWTYGDINYWLKIEPCIKIPSMNDVFIPAEVMLLAEKIIDKKKKNKTKV